MLDGDSLKDHLIKEGISKVGYTNVNVDEFSNLNYGISLVLRLPKEAIEALLNDEFKKYWKIFHQQIDTLTEIALNTEKLIKDNGYDAFALTMQRNECDMEKLLSKLPYKTLATSSNTAFASSEKVLPSIY